MLAVIIKIYNYLEFATHFPLPTSVSQLPAPVSRLRTSPLPHAYRPVGARLFAYIALCAKLCVNLVLFVRIKGNSIHGALL